MRIQFQKGKQKEFLSKVKNKSKTTWENLAKKVNIKKGTLKSYYYEKRTMPKKIVDNLSELFKIKYYNFRLLPENWGQLKAGKKNFKNLKVNTKSKEFAEIVGIILGDGHLSKNRKIVGIYLNKYTEEPYAKYVLRLFNKLKIPYKKMFVEVK